MTADVVRFSDYAPRERFAPATDQPAVIVILPVVRVETFWPDPPKPRVLPPIRVASYEELRRILDEDD